MGYVLSKKFEVGIMKNVGADTYNNQQDRSQKLILFNISRDSILLSCCPSPVELAEAQDSCNFSKNF